MPSPATPYPYDRNETSTDRTLTVIMWLASVAVAPWILIFPPVSYEGLGLVASVGWGVMTGLGAALILVGTLRHSYITELPGVFLMGLGLLVYTILSWGQVADGTVGSGARALLMITFTIWLVKRGKQLVRYHLTLERIERLGRG